ncbi:hypothetical protein ILUMI_26803, partial [Ignelater luminosus]
MNLVYQTRTAAWIETLPYANLSLEESMNEMFPSISPAQNNPENNADLVMDEDTENEYPESSSGDDSLKDPHFIPCTNQDLDSAKDGSIIKMGTQTIVNKSVEENSRFFKQKKNLYSSCKTYKNLGEEEKEAKKEELERHKKEIELSRQEKKTEINHNCSVQNKNKYLMSMYMYVVEKFDIEKITHKYLIAGHTKSEGEGMLKKNPIYVPKEFVDWKKVCGTMGKNFVINEMNERVMWGGIKIMEVRKEQQNKMYYKTSYEEEEYRVVHIR